MIASVIFWVRLASGHSLFGLVNSSYMEIQWLEEDVLEAVAPWAGEGGIPEAVCPEGLLFLLPAFST